MNNVFHSGFVALIGRPNVGKSTLLNRILQQKISIVSDKAQTTRSRILGVYTEQDRQIVFLDTPGVHKPQHKLGEWMRKETISALEDVDLVLFMTAADEKAGAGDRYILHWLEELKVPVYLVINKIDRIPRQNLLAIIADYSERFSFAEVIPVSAATGEQVPELIAAIGSALPLGPQYFPADMVTDRPERNIVAELIREQLLLRTYEEIPHALAVDIEEMTTRQNGTVYIRATVYVERESQKRIVIGKKGSVLHEVGEASRMQAERLLAAKVYLDLWVKVAPDWRNKDRALKELGYE